MFPYTDWDFEKKDGGGGVRRVRRVCLTCYTTKIYRHTRLTATF